MILTADTEHRSCQTFEIRIFVCGVRRDKKLEGEHTEEDCPGNERGELNMLQANESLGSQKARANTTEVGRDLVLLGGLDDGNGNDDADDRKDDDNQDEAYPTLLAC